MASIRGGDSSGSSEAAAARAGGLGGRLSARPALAQGQGGLGAWGRAWASRPGARDGMSGVVTPRGLLSVLFWALRCCEVQVSLP